MRAVAEVGVENIAVDRRCDPRASASPSCRLCISGRPTDEAIPDESLIVEIDADERIVALVTFDVDDIDAAFEELDARYLAGEAAATRTPGR